MGRLPTDLRLMTKALVVLGSAILFGAVEVGLALYFKADLLTDFEHLTSLSEQHQSMMVAELVADDLRVDFGHLAGADPDRRGRFAAEAEAHLASILAMGGAVEVLSTASALPELRTTFRRLREEAPGSADFDELNGRVLAALDDFDARLDDSLTRTNATREKLAAAYHDKSNLSAGLVLAVGVAFLAAVVAAIGAFVSRLIGDLGRLSRRAQEIRGGNYGTTLKLARGDEVGSLAEAMNDMAAELARHERQAAEFQRQIAQQEKMFTVGTFAAGIAHDLGNPLQSMLALIDDLKDCLAEEAGGADLARAREGLELIETQSDRLDAVLREISEFSSPTPAERTAVDINAVADSTLRLLRFDPRMEKVELARDLAPDLKPVLGSADQLAQVIMNLVLNAADAIDGSAGKITVAASNQDGAVVLSVADNGAGMDDEVRTHVLEPFFTTKPRGQGTGLGLAVCDAIVQDHDGSLTIESSPGEGTTVTVRLPAHAQEEA